MYETQNSKKRKEEKGNAKLKGRGGKDGGEEIKEAERSREERREIRNFITGTCLLLKPGIR